MVALTQKQNSVPGGRQERAPQRRPAQAHAELTGWISKGSGLHAHVAGYGRGWPLGLRREENTISTLMRAEIARRYRRCRQATYGRSQLGDRAARSLEMSIERRGSFSSARGGANGARPRGGVSPRRAFKSGFKAGRMPSPNVLPHDSRPSAGTHSDTTVAAAHTLTHLGGAKPPRHGRQPPHSRDTDEDHPCGHGLLFGKLE